MKMAFEGLLSNVRQDVGRHFARLESCLLGRNGFDVAGPLLEPYFDEALHDLCRALFFPNWRNW